MRRSTKELIRGFLWIGLMILMITCIIANIHTENVSGIIVCSLATILNLSNAITSFKEYKSLKEWEDEYFKACMEKNCPEESDILFD